ncbi:hypothetical protein AYL99_07189 [Fonsecaea erecta]|uniref:Uncharacterized protein n=1 Tax=Fonsecaea erecta TaxID=1367422 RepID=A0A178ZE91_9EURO|nr:hypothetical protein AYL99_07189 [Fonsecaea erecta]OAP58099.1 hypothetical protein AYL99_07189 [Fonsecaea erecta]
MAEDPPKVLSPRPVQANIPVLDGSTDQPSNTAAGLPSDPTSHQPAQDGEGDLIMTSPTAPKTEASAAASTLPKTTGGPVPLDSPLRTTPIHPSLPSVKVSDAALTSAPNTNPITLQPFTEAELQKYGFEKLRAQILSAAATAVTTAEKETEEEIIARMREETAALLKQKLDEREARTREIEREMEEKEKIREVERKVFRKKLAGGKEG